jgi:DNA-binding protein HU-beta
MGSGKREQVVLKKNRKKVGPALKKIILICSVIMYTLKKLLRGGFMTKAELVEKMAKEAKIAKKAAEKALASFVDGVRKTLKKGNKVTLIGFGTFSVGKRKAKVGRNPRTGKAIKIAARKIAKFKAGKSLKDLIK